MQLFYNFVANTLHHVTFMRMLHENNKMLHHLKRANINVRTFVAPNQNLCYVYYANLNTKKKEIINIFILTFNYSA